MSIQLEYLCTLKTKHDIENRLGQLPPKLVDIYSQLFRRRTESYGHEHRRILDVALSSLLLPVRPDATVFAHMLFASEGDDSSEEDESSGGSEADMSASGTVNRAQVIQRPEAVTELCFNLVVFDCTSNVFRFAHTSVQEYLLKHEDGYYASQDLNCSRLAEHCISLLLHVPDQIHSKDQTFLRSERQQGQTDRRIQMKDTSTTNINLYYVQPSPISSWARLERTLNWVQYNWGFFVFNSREYREKLPLRDLELDLQHALASQPWKSVNPRIFFSACYQGLGSFVDTWTTIHPHLVNVRLLPAADEKGMMLATGLQHACAGGHSKIIKRLIDKGASIDYYSQGTPKTNALCIALQRRTCAITKLLLDRGASPSLAPDSDVRFPLQAIIWDGHVDALPFVQTLLEHGADIDLEDNQGVTAIAFAVARENFEVVHLLLQKNAKPTFSLPANLGRVYILGSATKIRTTPVQSLKMAQLMLEHGLDVNFRDSWGNMPLWWAAINGNLAVTRLLLDHGAFIDVQEESGRTPLMAAISKMQPVPETQVQVSRPPGKPFQPIAQVREHEDVARLLISSGANTNLRATSGFTALHHATEKGSSKIMELLINHGADPTIADTSGATPLHLAAGTGREDTAKFLLAHNADMNAVALNGWTALHAAAFEGHTNTLALLVDAGSNLDAADHAGNTALNLAAANLADKSRALEIVELLLSHNANPNTSNSTGCTALHRAVEHGFPGLVELLLSRNADPNFDNRPGQIALHGAVEKGEERIVELLITYNANLHARGGKAWTTLHRATDNGHESIVKILLTHDADVNAQTLNGWTALHLAAHRGHANMIPRLVNAGSDLNAIDYLGHTALDGAAIEGRDMAVRALLNLGANPKNLVFHGNSALSSAACSGKPEVCELLLSTTTDINSQDGDGDTALSNAVDQSQPPYIINLLLGAGAQIVPQQAGPHCPFLHHTERIEGYGIDALLRAWEKDNSVLIQTILRFAAKIDPRGEYATALELWENKEKEEFEAWMKLRRANAPENRPEVVTFREEIKWREDEIYKQNKRPIAMELGIDPPAEE